ncbi:hypothetical protein CEXT_525531 [Caerostris extrusa]|uniref:Uncharacterized protein n=1 Tax=Caerostris extrusa TaxID=172846 RepID=A0AAV4XZU3_CAEEX|nr:hypothetical protein CEXT_525531 [Caerostris extrusa]
MGCSAPQQQILPPVTIHNRHTRRVCAFSSVGIPHPKNRNTDDNHPSFRCKTDYRKDVLTWLKRASSASGDESQSATVTGSSDVGSPPSYQRTPENPRNRTLCSARTVPRLAHARHLRSDYRPDIPSPPPAFKVVAAMVRNR